MASSTRSRDDGVLHRPQRRRGPRRHTDLAVDVLDVVIGGLGGDVEPIGDLARRESLGRQSQHVDFAASEPARIDGALPRRPSWLTVPCGYQYRTAGPRLEDAL